MICGSKWKTCNCPWFNYETVENDRVLHMQIPDNNPFAPIPQPRQIRVRNYDDEINDRRRQERADEVLARRLQGLGIHDRDRDDDYNGGIGEIMGIGNGAGHFMNESFRRPGVGGGINYMRDRRPPPTLERYNPFLPAPPAPLPLRIRATDMIDRYTPPAPLPMRKEIMQEIISPSPSRYRERDRDRGRRTRDSSAAHTPERSRSSAVREKVSHEDSIGSSELAGLNTRGSGGGSGRVKAWRAHVEPGLAPTEVLSM